MKKIITVIICSLPLNIYGQNWNILLSNINKPDSIKIRQLIDEVTYKPDIVEFKIPSNATDSIKNIIEQKNDSLYKIKSSFIDKRVRAKNTLSENYLYLNNLNNFSGILITPLWREYKYDKNIRLILASLNLSKSQRDSLLNFSGSEILVKAKLGDSKAIKNLSQELDKAIISEDIDKMQKILVQLLFVNNKESINIFSATISSNKIFDYNYTKGDYSYHQRIALCYFSLSAMWMYNPYLKFFSPGYYQEYLKQNGIRKAFLEEFSVKDWEIYIQEANKRLAEIFDNKAKILVPFLVDGIYPIDPSDKIQ
jgi:hypothetical protein